ncbi:MAG: hypothetical protein ACYC5G_06210 [Candidatus Doudnabacteria bacterium]
MTQQEAILQQCKRDGLSLSGITNLQNTYNKKEPDVRDYLTNTLRTLLCDRYSVSHYTKTQKLIDLVTQELNI